MLSLEQMAAMPHDELVTYAHAQQTIAGMTEGALVAKEVAQSRLHDAQRDLEVAQKVAESKAAECVELQARVVALEGQLAG